MQAQTPPKSARRVLPYAWQRFGTSPSGYPHYRQNRNKPLNPTRRIPPKRTAFLHFASSSRSSPRNVPPQSANSLPPGGTDVSASREGVSVNPCNCGFSFRNRLPFRSFKSRPPLLVRTRSPPPRSHYSRPSRGEGDDLRRAIQSIRGRPSYARTRRAL